jgi:hypothetical protein
MSGPCRFHAQGCNIMECVDFLHPPYALVLDDPDEYDWERPLAEQHQPVGYGPRLIPTRHFANDATFC